MNALRRLLPALTVLLFVCAMIARVEAQTWLGPGTNWNTAGNWSTGTVPNSTTADVAFTGNAVGNVNIASSVSARSLSFSNPTGNYSLTSSAGVRLSDLLGISVDAGVTGVQTINLAPDTAGSLLFPTGGNLSITNNATAAGASLVLGPNMVIGTPGGGGVFLHGAGTTEISGTFATTGAHSVSGSVSMYGSGTLILSNPQNVYTGGTFIHSGTLLLGNGSALPPGQDVQIDPGAQFNIGGLGNSVARTIGALELGGTFRVPSGSNDYYLNQLDSYDGATIDFTGADFFFLHLRDAGAQIVAFSNSQWIGGPSSHIQNDTNSPIVITVNINQIETASGIDLDDGIALSNAGLNSKFILHFGETRLTNLANNADIDVADAKLRVDDISSNGGVGALGSGAIRMTTFESTRVIGGTLLYGGPTATSTKNLTLDTDTNIQILTAGVNLTYNGIMTETNDARYLYVGPTDANGPISTLTLGSNNSYSGATTVQGNMTLVVPSLAKRNLASPIGTDAIAAGITLGVFGRGTLSLSGTNSLYTIDRDFHLAGLYPNGGAIDVQNATTQLSVTGKISNGATAGSLIKLGDGTMTVNNKTNNYSGGTYILGGTLKMAAAGALPGNTGVTIDAGAVLNINFLDLNITNVAIDALQGAGSVTNTFNHTLTIGGANGSGEFSGAISSTSTLNVTKTGGGTEVFSGANTYTGNTTVTSGTLTVAATGSIASPNILVSPGAVLNLDGSVPTTAAITANGFVNASATVNFGGNTGSSAFTRTIDRLSAGNNGQAIVLASTFAATPVVLQIASSLTFGTSAKLDLTNNELITNETLATVRQQIVAGTLFTSTVDGGTGMLGSIDLHDGTVEVRYTLKGDATLNGIVDVGDLGALATNYNTIGGATWEMGDSNYDDNVDVGDLGALATNYGASLLSGSAPASTAAMAVTSVAVPEPGGFALIGIGVAGLIGRHRRLVIPADIASRSR